MKTFEEFLEEQEELAENENKDDFEYKPVNPNTLEQHLKNSKGHVMAGFASGGSSTATTFHDTPEEDARASSQRTQ